MHTPNSLCNECAANLLNYHRDFYELSPFYLFTFFFWDITAWCFYLQNFHVSALFFFLFLIHSLYCSNNGNLSSVRALFDNTEALPFFLFQTFFRIFYLQFICLIPYISWYSDSRKFCERDNFWTTLHVFLFFFLFAISVCQREK